MKGGVILFRGTGTAARRYLESDRSTADEYYLEGGTALAEFAVSGHDGEVIETRTLDPEGYAAWVDWTDPITGKSMGTRRAASDRSKESPRFAEMVINAPKSLSIAAALHPEVPDALDAAQQDAALLAGVVESLTQEAATDGAEFLAAQQADYTAHRAKANAPRFRKRSATRTAKEADARREAAEWIVHGRWQSIPHSESGLPAWAEAVAQRQADHAPKIVEARAEATQAHQVVGEIAERQSREHTALYERLLGNRRPDAVAARVKNLREQATRDRRYLSQLDALPPDEAVQLVRERAAQDEAHRLAAEEARGAAEALAKRLGALDE